MDEKYFPEKIEEKWQREWEQTGAFQVERDDARPKFYCLEMLPYPSGYLHMGHVRNYSIGDALSWYKRLRGFNVLHPIGWDSFGQPAEQAAIKRGVMPMEWTEENIAHMRGQLKRIGVSYDWRREIAAHRPDYYKWDQWFFLKLYERGLAYKRASAVNWCPKEQTVLSNEQSSGGVCWRCGTQVEKKDLEQWFIRITEYAEQLLDDMAEIEAGWPERVLTMQRNWINRSVGAYIDFPVKDSDAKVRVFTTRIDTIYGATAVIVAAEHPLLSELPEGSSLKADVDRFVARLRAERASRAAIVAGGEEEEKEGVNTGLFVTNPFSGEQLPVWVANYVLMDYGAGAVMSVPAHDERDFEFAQKYSLPIRRVIERVSHEQEQIAHDERELDQSVAMPHAFTDYGILVNSGEWGGKLSADAIREMAEYAQREGFGGGAVTYRLRDWGISRQKFWGAPIPVIYCEDCGVVPVPEKDLPVVLPERAEFTGAGESPLAGVAEFVNTTCPKCAKPARRETDTMDTFVDSSWYFYRYCDPHNDRAAFDTEVVKYWTPVDQYIGGIDHAVMHLLYTRFWTKFMRDIGLVEFDEPVKNLMTQGMVTNLIEGTDEWRRMSKSLGNGVDPDDMIEAYGADAVRLFVLFAAPPENELRWQETGIEGAVRFLRRVYTFIWRWRDSLRDAPRGVPSSEDFSAAARALRHETHRAIVRVTEGFERMSFNTNVAALMELSNALGEFQAAPDGATPAERFAVREALESLVLMLTPFTPHVAEELWEGLGHEGGIIAGLKNGSVRWPQAEESLARRDELEIPVQINGKLRGRIRATRDTAEDELRIAALSDERVRAWTEGRDIVKVIVVPQRLVNIVVR
ncbi:MAG: leucine--tRNA ligase [Pyrinomonadaceae bacterium]|nr:leucine--tRNA ligase [Pyrinomonadaceae bacterium]